MKKFINLLFIFFLVSASSNAQNWETNIDTALNKANTENKEIVLVFSGLDWCVPCVKMERNIWQSNEFISFATENLILLKADFPKNSNSKKNESQNIHNNMLKDKYNPKGLFPMVVLLDINGEEIGHTLYKNVKPNKYIEILNKIITEKE